MYRKVAVQSEHQSSQGQHTNNNGGLSSVLTIIPETTTESSSESSSTYYYDNILKDVISQIIPKPSNGTLDVNYKILMMESSSKNKGSKHKKDDKASKSEAPTSTTSSFHHGFSFYVMGDTPVRFMATQMTTAAEVSSESLSSLTFPLTSD